MPKTSGARRARAGFTLVELMVASTVTLILAGILLSFFSGILSSWSDTSARTESYREARAALYLLNRELATSVPLPDGSSSVRTDLFLSPEVVGPGLGFLTRVHPMRQPEGENPSDLCAVVYFLAPVTQAGETSLALHRRLIPSRSVFERLALGDDVFSDVTGPDSDFTEVVAENVTGFDVLLMDDTFQLLTGPEETSAPLVAPSRVEVRLMALSSRGATAYFDPTASDARREQIVLKEGREFKLRRHL